MHRFVDVSHVVESGMTTYKGLPAPLVCDFLSREQSRIHYAPGTEFHVGRIEMVANTGTYLDAPFHRYADGADIAALALDRLASLEGLVVRWDMQAGRAIRPEAFEPLALAGRAVLIETGLSRHWRTDQYFEGRPFLTWEAAALLREAGATLVGVDSLNIDDIEDGSRPPHPTLLAAGVPIAEHLCDLHRLPTDGFRFFAVPAKVKGMGTFPVRAFGVIE